MSAAGTAPPLSPPIARMRCALPGRSPRKVRCGWPSCAPLPGWWTPRVSCSAMFMAGSPGSAAAPMRCRIAGMRRSGNSPKRWRRLPIWPIARSRNAASHRRRASAPADHRVFRRRGAPQAAASDHGLRRTGLRRRFRSRCAALPHFRLVRSHLRRGKPRGTAGHRAIEHGPALPGAAGVSLRTADVARLCLRRAAGVGGAAMWRFLRAYLPECAPTLVEADEGVAAIARRWFYLSQPVVVDTAERFLAGNRQHFDVVLVDLYDARGPAPLDEAFWTRAIDALAPGGCLATNWADFATNKGVRPMAEAQETVAQARGLASYFVTRRGFRDNLIQYLPTGGERQPEAITGALERFAAERRLPDRGRGILEHCLVSARFPIGL